MEHTQSFILSWTVIEQYIESNLKELIIDKKIQGKRKKRLKNKFIDVKLEILNLNSYIDIRKYEKITLLRNLRNKFMHELKLISRDNAKDAFFLSKDLLQEILKKTSLELSFLS